MKPCQSCTRMTQPRQRSLSRARCARGEGSTEDRRRKTGHRDWTQHGKRWRRERTSRHRKAQLICLVRGELTCEGSSAIWIVPPQSALWIPASLTHRIRARAPLEGHCIFLAPRTVRNLPKDCCAVSVTPLFRELRLELATRPARYDPGNRTHGWCACSSTSWRRFRSRSIACRGRSSLGSAGSWMP